MSARIVNTIAEAIDDGPDPVTQVTELSQTILDALRANGFEVVELPEPNHTSGEEIEWFYSSANSDGIVNLGIHDGGVEINIGHDLGQSVDSLPTTAEGFIPLSLLVPTAAALLAAANDAEATR